MNKQREDFVTRLREALEAINRVESDLGWTDDTKAAIAKIEASICDVQEIAIDQKTTWHRLVTSLGCMFDFDTSGSLEEIAASARDACDRRSLASLQSAQEPVRDEVTPEMIAAAEAVDDLYRMGQPQLWARVYRAMRAASPLPQSALSTDAQKVRDQALEEAAQMCEAQRNLTIHGMAIAKGCAAAIRALQSQSLPSAEGDAEDARRIDFMAAEECQIERIELHSGDRFRVRWPDLDEAQSYWFETPRAAIDAAIAHKENNRGL